MSHNTMHITPAHPNLKPKHKTETLNNEPQLPVPIHYKRLPLPSLIITPYTYCDSHLIPSP